MNITKTEFIEYLRTTLIPDLLDSGHDRTAADLEAAILFMSGAEAVDIIGDMITSKPSESGDELDDSVREDEEETNNRLKDALFVAEMDQQVSIVREAIKMMGQDDVIKLFKECGKGLVKDMLRSEDEESNDRLSLVIGRLAAVGIWKLIGKHAD